MLRLFKSNQHKNAVPSSSMTDETASFYLISIRAFHASLYSQYSWHSFKNAFSPLLTLLLNDQKNFWRKKIHCDNYQKRRLNRYILNVLRITLDQTKTFNITADCKPHQHYMVDLDSRLAQIKEYLKDEYCIVSMDFQMQMSYAKFRNENTFSVAFAKAFIRIVQNLETCVCDEMMNKVEDLGNFIRQNKEDLELVELFQFLSNICKASDKPLILMIDEIDSAANNQVFLDFLAQLRGYYIDRDHTPTFRSVILAGVYDVKNLKRKFRSEKEHRMNSPWNIAVEFKVDMNFSAEEIAEMLEDYEKEHATGMNIAEISKLIYAHTSGYPFLVSKLCKLIDEEVAGSKNFPTKQMAWTYAGFLEASRILLAEKTHYLNLW